MDVDWIREFKASPGAVTSWRGHVFLEVHVEGAWQLLDASAMRLYEDYDVASRFLPGNRFAYDKGDDPFALVLSCRWELWKEQTRRYFAALDETVLPWSRSRDLLAAWRVWITGNRPIYGYATDACKRLGFHVRRSFNTEWATWLPQARGSILIVTCQGGRPVLPETLWDAWFKPSEVRPRGQVIGPALLHKKGKDDKGNHTDQVLQLLRPNAQPQCRLNITTLQES